MKVGRNDPCPCGSGKKYKKCCLSKEDAAESTYQRISAAYNAQVNKLLAFGSKELGDDFLDVAMDAFFLGKEEDGEPPVFDGFSQLFVPWALFTWRLLEEERGFLDVELPLPVGTTVAELYLQKKAGKLDNLEQDILEAAKRAPFSFHEILDVSPGQGFRCQDLFCHRTHNVMEQSASQVLQPGDIYYCSMARLEEFDILLGTSPVKFPPEIKAEVLELRNALEEEQGGSLTWEQLLDYDMATRYAFMRLLGVETGFSEEYREEYSEEEDAYSSRIMHYTIDSPQKAFEALHDLCVSETREQQLADATFDALGKITAAEILWDAPDGEMEANEDLEIIDESNRGFITIKDTSMTVEVIYQHDEDVIMDCINARLRERAQFVSFEELTFEEEGDEQGEE